LKFPPPDGEKATGWLYRVVDKRPKLAGMQTISLSNHDVGGVLSGNIKTSELPIDAIPVAGCRRIEIQLTWFAPAVTALRNAKDIQENRPPYVKLPTIDIASDDVTFIRLPVNGDITFGEFCGAYASSKTATGAIGDTVSAVFKAVGDSQTAAAKVLSPSSAK
jgi:hypothetical protein